MATEIRTRQCAPPDPEAVIALSRALAEPPSGVQRWPPAPALA